MFLVNILDQFYCLQRLHVSSNDRDTLSILKDVYQYVFVATLHTHFGGQVDHACVYPLMPFIGQKISFEQNNTEVENID